mmetsp:Transcript_9289/g.14655  ORF Transcript_9289/g.14655 Transcript_9289/m.14655 type:complete len:116 (-) Transcript_9289:704-1051(-)
MALHVLFSLPCFRNEPSDIADQTLVKNSLLLNVKYHLAFQSDAFLYRKDHKFSAFSGFEGQDLGLSPFESLMCVLHYMLTAPSAPQILSAANPLALAPSNTSASQSVVLSSFFCS